MFLSYLFSSGLLSYGILYHHQVFRSDSISSGVHTALSEAIACSSACHHGDSTPLIIEKCGFFSCENWPDV